MKKLLFLRFTIGYLLLLGCGSQNNNQQQEFRYEAGNPYGTGKWFMGREIANVMGFEGMEWLERPEREKEENSSTLIRNMNIQPDDVIADIGAGSGYHVFKMAPMINKGQIYAVDIQEEMLNEIQKKSNNKGVQNVNLIKGGEKSANLPENSVDKVLMVDVYHEFSFPKEMMASIKKALRPNGKIFLVEYRGEDPLIPILKVHKMTEKQAIKEMKSEGFKLMENIENLPWQHCMVFVKKES